MRRDQRTDPTTALWWLRTSAYLLVTAAVTTAAVINTDGWQSIGAGVTGALGLGAVFVRERFPYVFAVVAGLMTIVATQALLIPAILSLTTRRRDRFSVAALLAAVALLALTAGRGERFVTVQGVDLDAASAFGSWVLNAAVIAIVPALVGWTVGARRELVLSYRARAEQAEAERASLAREAMLLERARIADEAHDILGHKLTLLALQAGGLELNVAGTDHVAATQATQIRANARDALHDLRTLIGSLDGVDDSSHRQMLTPKDFHGVQRLIEEHRNSGSRINVDATTLLDPAELPEPIARALYRVVQECLTNARKHAPGAPVQLTFRGQPGRSVMVEVRNIIRAGAVEPVGGGRGIPGLHERARLVGGTIEVSQDDAVFILRANLPWPATASEPRRSHD